MKTTYKAILICVICAAMSGCINSGADEISPPLTMEFDIVPVDVGEKGDPYILELDLYENGTSLMRTTGTAHDQPIGCLYSTLIETDVSTTYTISFGDMPMVATLKDDHTATLTVEGYVFEGTWK